MDENEINSLAAYQGPDRVVCSTEFWEMIKDRKPPRKQMTGFPKLDLAIDGFEDEELIIVSGPTGHGKTTFCRTLMTNMAKQGKRALFLCYENSPTKIAAEHRFPENSLYLPLEHRPMDLSWLERRCVEASVKYEDLSAIFVDHLHYVLDAAKKQNISLEIGETVRFLKQLAVRLSLPVFLVCHVTKIKPEEEPSIGHLRDSAMIGCEADTVLMVWRGFSEETYGKLPQQSSNEAMLKVEKSRRLGTMGYKIQMYKEGLTLHELKTKYED